jgi:hypothetical protein
MFLVLSLLKSIAQNRIMAVARLPQAASRWMDVKATRA